MVFKFQDDPMVNEYEIVVLLRQVWVYEEKERFLEEKEGRTNL